MRQRHTPQALAAPYDRSDAHGEDSSADEKTINQPSRRGPRREAQGRDGRSDIAGVNAFEEFMRTSRLVQDGIVYDMAGGAFVTVRSPAWHFRESLKRLYPGPRGSGGRWTLNIEFGEKPSNMNQSMTAAES